MALRLSPGARQRVVAGALAALLLGANLASPLYGVYRDRFGFNSLVLTLVFAVYALVLAPSLLFFGELSDRIGRRPVILGGLVAGTIGLGLFAVATNVAWLFAARIAQGCRSAWRAARPRRRSSSSTLKAIAGTRRCSQRWPRRWVVRPARC